jgi:Co/Zn/Cd efflux system component
VEILGALVSVIAIWAVTGALLYEAVLRVINPHPVDGKIMFITACAGIAFNVVRAESRDKGGPAARLPAQWPAGLPPRGAGPLCL